MLENSHAVAIRNINLKGSVMKTPFASMGAAAILAAGLILAPGLSPAQASTAAASTATSSISSFAPGSVATTYGMWFVPCNIFGFRMC